MFKFVPSLRSLSSIEFGQALQILWNCIETGKPKSVVHKLVAIYEVHTIEGIEIEAQSCRKAGTDEAMLEAMNSRPWLPWLTLKNQKAVRHSSEDVTWRNQAEYTGLASSEFLNKSADLKLQRWIIRNSRLENRLTGHNATRVRLPWQAVGAHSRVLDCFVEHYKDEQHIYMKFTWICNQEHGGE